LENLIEGGVIDPASVVTNALEYGSGVASILLTSEVAIINEDPLQ
jgi:chaperonin GroEL (HSP60 family)